MKQEQERLNDITSRIIGCAFTVGCELGTGYVEKVYENALVHEMRKQGLRVRQQVALEVIYDGIVVGECLADVVVENCVLVELKATKGIEDAHIAQCLNYLKTTGFQVALILNFGSAKVGVKRLVRNF